MSTTPQPIGITLPLIDGKSGYFNQSFNIVDQINTNIIMLFQTKPGERRMNPSFGSRLWTALFEIIDDDQGQIIQSIVTQDLAKWIPYVNVKQVNITNNPDGNIVGVSVIYTANSAGITSPQSVTIPVQQQSL
jgi:phage baseplate assembly protein W